MAVILGELRESYKALLSERGLSLSSQTVDAARLAAQSVDAGAGEVAGIAVNLMREWRQLIDDPEEDGPEGWFSLTYTFDAFAGEVAGNLRHYAAVEYVTGAAVELPAEAITPSGVGQLVQIDFNEEVNEDDPGVQMLRKFSSVIGIAEENFLNGMPCEIDELRATVFG
jgi:hypothetical protein